MIPRVETMEVARIASIALVVLGTAYGEAAAQSFDLTGHWTGTLRCKFVTDGTKETRVGTPALAVSQVGNAVVLALDYGNGTVERYTGLANPDGKKPLTKGEVGIIRCGTDSDAANAAGDEIGRLFATTKAPPSAKASLRGQSVASTPPGIGTCSWKWVRTDVADPGLGTECER